jgi:hypothetical protein
MREQSEHVNTQMVANVRYSFPPLRSGTKTPLQAARQAYNIAAGRVQELEVRYFCLYTYRFIHSFCGSM